VNNNFTDWNPLENNNNSNNNSDNTNSNYHEPELLENTTSMPAVEAKPELLDSTQPMPVVEEKPKVEMVNPNLPNISVNHNSSSTNNIRFNPVTGAEEDINQIMKESNKKDDSFEVEDKLKHVEVDYKPTSTWNTILLIGFFIFLVLFVYFLPEIQTTISNYRTGNIEKQVEEITTGKLVCTLESNTTNLTRNIERVFNYEDNQLKRATFTTVVRGDIVQDEAALDELNEQCQKVRDGVSLYDGVSIHCTYNAGQLEETEVFDYQVMPMDDITGAYLDAGASLLELEYNENIDQVMTLMRQGGFTCNKEK
jgi:hypothetical protein